MTVLVGTRDGLRILDASRPVQHFHGHAVTALAAENGAWYALLDGSSVWRCEDGETWAEIGVVHDAAITCILPTGDGVVCGAERAHLYRLTDGRGRRLDGFDAVVGRDSWYTPWAGPPAVRSLAGDGTALFANVHVGGIPRSDDAGRTWTPTIDVDADVHQVVRHDDVVLAATAMGLAVSNDAGTSWRFDADGLRHGYCRAVAVADGHVLVSASAGPGGGDAALYRRALDGTTFAPCERGFPGALGGNIDTHWLSASGSRVACALPDGSVLVSDDAGASWDELADDLPPVHAVLCAG